MKKLLALLLSLALFLTSAAGAEGFGSLFGGILNGLGGLGTGDASGENGDSLWGDIMDDFGNLFSDYEDDFGDLFSDYEDYYDDFLTDYVFDFIGLFADYLDDPDLWYLGYISDLYKLTQTEDIGDYFKFYLETFAIMLEANEDMFLDVLSGESDETSELIYLICEELGLSRTETDLLLILLGDEVTGDADLMRYVICFLLDSVTDSEFVDDLMTAADEVNALYEVLEILLEESGEVNVDSGKAEDLFGGLLNGLFW